MQYFLLFFTVVSLTVKCSSHRWKSCDYIFLKVRLTKTSSISHVLNQTEATERFSIMSRCIFTHRISATLPFAFCVIAAKLSKPLCSRSVPFPHFFFLSKYDCSVNGHKSWQNAFGAYASMEKGCVSILWDFTMFDEMEIIVQRILTPSAWNNVGELQFSSHVEESMHY